MCHTVCMRACSESDLCMRQCCGPSRGFIMHITDNYGQVTHTHLLTVFICFLCQFRKRICCVYFVHSLDFVSILCFCFSYCIYVVLLSAQWGGSNGIEAQSLGPLFLQCFDTVGLVFWPIKPVPDMTYNVFGGTLNLAQFNSENRKLFFAGWLACSHVPITQPTENSSVHDIL